MLLETVDLLSKWGFEDGDVLYRLKVEHGLKVNSATLLVEVVKRCVLPELRKNHQLEATIVLGLHNPIRLTQVDGVAVDDEKDDHPFQLTPAFVEVADDLVLAVANEPQLIAEQAEIDQWEVGEGVRRDDPSQRKPFLDVMHRRLRRQLAGLNGEE